MGGRESIALAERTNVRAGSCNRYLVRPRQAPPFRGLSNSLEQPRHFDSEQFDGLYNPEFVKGVEKNCS